NRCPVEGCAALREAISEAARQGVILVPDDGYCRPRLRLSTASRPPHRGRDAGTAAHNQAPCCAVVSSWSIVSGEKPSIDSEPSGSVSPCDGRSGCNARDARRAASTTNGATFSNG